MDSITCQQTNKTLTAPARNLIMDWGWIFHKDPSWSKTNIKINTKISHWAQNHGHPSPL